MQEVALLVRFGHIVGAIPANHPDLEQVKTLLEGTTTYLGKGPTFGCAVSDAIETLRHVQEIGQWQYTTRAPRRK